jgi:hypothetical protein
MIVTLIEFLRDFWTSPRRHRKRGNAHIRPLGIVMSWRMAQCAALIRRGPPYRRFRWMR